ncbi:MAG: hypothetical protein C4318_06305 [Acidimicrobiia bacterium]
MPVVTTDGVEAPFLVLSVSRKTGSKRQAMDLAGGSGFCLPVTCPCRSPSGTIEKKWSMTCEFPFTMSDSSDCHQILVVCTANVCRSVMAEHLLTRELRERGLRDAFCVVSAGTRVVFSPWERDCSTHLPSRGAVEVLRRRGIEVGNHTRRRVVPDILDASSLVLTMERFHLEETINLWPPVEPRAFVLKEAAILAESKPFGAVDFESRVKELDARRSSARDVLYLDKSIDVEDPIGGTLEYYEACATEIEDALRRLLETLWVDLEIRSREHENGKG